MTAELDLGAFRLVDPHVHHWDPVNTEWYPFLSPDFDLADLAIAGAESMRRRYLVEDYLADAAPWNLDKYVHVNATGGEKAYLGEAEWLAGLGGRLAGVIGTVELEQDPGAVVADLERQAEYPLFRGIRNMVIPDFGSASFDAGLRFLSEHGLVYDFLVHPSTMTAAVEVIRRHPDLEVVVEHVGWPLATDDAERALWREGMRALADTRAGVACKLSGIAMTTHTVTVDAVRPWFDEAIALFGADRCLAASNFPVDGAFGSYDELMRTYLAIIGEYGEAAVSAVFADNAERIYRLS